MLDLQFWRISHSSTARSAGVSFLVHAVLIAAGVAATLPSNELLSDPRESRVRYLPPPNPKPPRDPSVESLRFVELAPEGAGTGFAPAPIQPARSPVASLGPQEGNTGRDSVTAIAEDGSEGTDSVFTIIDVDTAATRLPESAAPQYPRDLLQRGVEGKAVVQFVVDTTGRADPMSFQIILASHPDFAQSVRDALPEMRFSTARIGRQKVRQLVELPFNFRVAQPLVPVAIKAKQP